MPGRVRLSKQDVFYTAFLVTRWKLFFLRKCFIVSSAAPIVHSAFHPLTDLILRPRIMSCLKKQIIRGHRPISSLGDRILAIREGDYKKCVREG